MRLLRSKKFLWTLFILSIFLGLGFIKVITSFSLERYLSYLLETPVNIKSLKLSSLELYGTIKDKDNLAYVKVNKLYPLEVDFTYDGNADAFEVYQPLKGQGKLKGQLFYKDLLRVDGDIFVLGAKAKVEVNEQVEGWEVLSKISHLKLSQLTKENGVKIPASGSINADININTAEDSYIQMHTDEIKIKTESFEDVNLTMSFEDDDIDLKGKFRAPNFEYKDLSFHYDQNTSLFKGRFELLYKKTKRDIIFELQGEHKASKLAIQADAHIEDSHITTQDFKYDMDTHDFSSHFDISLIKLESYRYLLKAFDIDLKGDFKAKAELSFEDKKYEGSLLTHSLGGETRVSYKDEMFMAQANKLEVSKVFSLLNKPASIRGKLELKSSYDKQRLNLNLASEELRFEGERLEAIDLNISGPLQDLKANIALENRYATVHSSDVSIKGFNTINLEANVTTPYLSDPFILKGEGLYTEHNTTAWLNAKSSQIFFVLPKVLYTKERIEGEYLTVIGPRISGLIDPVNIKGEFTYDDSFALTGRNTDFGGKIDLDLKDEQINLKGQGVSLDHLLKQVKQPVYMKGDIDFSAKGPLDDLQLQLNSKHLHLNKAQSGLDENFTASIIAQLNPNEILMEAKLHNRYLDLDKGLVHYVFANKALALNAPLILKIDDTKRNFLLNLDADLSQDIKAKAQLSHQEDTLNLSNLSYTDGALKTDIEVDVQGLHLYNDLHDHEFFGPLVLKGKGSYINKKPYFNLDSPSLGGNLKIKLQDQDLHLTLDKLSAVEIGRLSKGVGSSHTGEMSGSIDYNLKTNFGATDLHAHGVKINGIDIDKQLQNINDMLSLNIFAMGKNLINKRYSRYDDVNLSTNISHMQFSVDITPEYVSSRDIALATDQSRFSVDTKLKRDGDIESFEIFILDYQGCSLVSQKLSGNITSPTLVDTKVASVILGRIPGNLMGAGGKLMDAGAGLLDTTSSFIWKKAFRQDTNLSYVQDGLSKGVNIFSSGREMVVSKDACEVVYDGAVNPPLHPDYLKELQDE